MIPSLDTALLIKKIRFAAEPDNPALIIHWLDAPLPEPAQDSATRQQYYRMQYNLLLDTLTDEFLPMQWRCCCLDCIYKPLQALSHLAHSRAEKREVRRLYFEVAMVGRCCLPERTLH